MLLPFASKFVFCNMLHHPLPLPLLSYLPGCFLAVWVFSYTFIINVNPNLQPGFLFLMSLRVLFGWKTSHLVTIKVLIVGDGVCSKQTRCLSTCLNLQHSCVCYLTSSSQLGQNSWLWLSRPFLGLITPVWSRQPQVMYYPSYNPSHLDSVTGSAVCPQPDQVLREQLLTRTIYR